MDDLDSNGFMAAGRSRGSALERGHYSIPSSDSTLKPSQVVIGWSESDLACIWAPLPALPEEETVFDFYPD